MDFSTQTSRWPLLRPKQQLESEGVEIGGGLSSCLLPSRVPITSDRNVLISILRPVLSDLTLLQPLHKQEEPTARSLHERVVVRQPDDRAIER